MKKKFTALSLALITVVFCAITLTACGSPPESVAKDGMIFTYNEATDCYTVKGDPEKKATLDTANIPDKIEKKKVVTVEPSGFKGFTALKSVNIPGTITVLESKAFEGCTALKTVTMTDGLMSIKESAFNGCTELTEALMPKTVRLIGASVFSDCSSLKTVTIGDDTTKIEAYAFYNCSKLEEVRLSKNLTGIGTFAFANCTALKEILFPTSKTLTLGPQAFEYAGLEKIYINTNIVMSNYTFGHVNWDADISGSKCTGVYFENPESNVGNNSIGYTWDNANVSGFRVYIPQGSLEHFSAPYGADESWNRCVVEPGLLVEYDLAETFPNGFPCLK